MSYNYEYSREFSEIYQNWNINNPERVDSQNNKVYLANEIANKIPNKSFLFYAGYKEYCLYLQDGSLVENPWVGENPLCFCTKEEVSEYVFDNILELTETIENRNPGKVLVQFEIELTIEEKLLLDTAVYNHKNNVPDKYAVWYQDAFVEDPGNPGSAYLFDTQELAQQFIVTDNLSGAIVKGIVIL